MLPIRKICETKTIPNMVKHWVFISANLLVVETFERDEVEKGVAFVSGISSIMN
jgi:hypothetical protein